MSRYRTDAAVRPNEWLKQKRPQSTEEECEAFADKVAFMCADNENIPVSEHRQFVYDCMFVGVSLAYESI